MTYMTRPALATRFLALVLCGMAASPALAKNCTLGNNYCVPFLGCIAETGDPIQGRAYGKTGGEIEARSASGISCRGTWAVVSDTRSEARFRCTDGSNGRMAISYFDRRSGTAWGEATLSNGHHLGMWSGSRIMAMIADQPKRMDLFMACAATN